MTTWLSFRAEEIAATATRPDPYPKDWPKIATRIKEAANWRCEHCNHPHDPASGHTLTVHHLDGNPANCDNDNLVALCQRCHLHIQARYFPGQLPLTGIEAPAWMIARGLTCTGGEKR